jgi:hypothetical protein
MVSGEFVMILLLNGPAKAKPVATRRNNVTKIDRSKFSLFEI